MPRELYRDGYFAFDWKVADGDFDLNRFLRLHPSIIDGNFAANASFDSGRFQPSDSDLGNGWTLCNGIAISPRMPKGEELPEHDCAPYDEWYIFDEYPKFSRLEGFCNDMGFSPIDFGWEERLNEFWSQIMTVRPLHCVGDGAFPYFLTHCMEAAALARNTEP